MFENNIELAKQIKEKRTEIKIHQRELSAFENNIKPQDNHDKYDRTLSHKQIIYQNIYQLKYLQREFRVKHIVLSMAHGNTISQIEPKVSSLSVDCRFRESVYSDVKDILKSMNKPWLETADKI